jgi:hypothetical protein
MGVPYTPNSKSWKQLSKVFIHKKEILVNKCLTEGDALSGGKEQAITSKKL